MRRPVGRARLLEARHPLVPAIAPCPATRHRPTPVLDNFVCRSFPLVLVSAEELWELVRVGGRRGGRGRGRRLMGRVRRQPRRRLRVRARLGPA